MTGPEPIPMDAAIRLCAEVRAERPPRLFSQCWGCLRASEGEATKMCMYRPPDNRGCGFVNRRFDATVR